MNMSSKDIEIIVQQVLASLSQPGAVAQGQAQTQRPVYSSFTRPQATGYKPIVKGVDGVFDRVEDAVEAAALAQREYVKTCKVSDRQRIIEAIRRAARKQVETLAKMVVEETKMGRYEDKLLKHLAVINQTPGTECLTTEAISGDNGLMIEEYAPFGVIAAITPTTNPTETIINNTISMIAGGNSVVFNVHPGAKKSSAYCLQLLNKTIVDAGGPENLITMTKEPTMENVDRLAAHPKVRMMVGTGGMGMVNALLRSGKKTIGAGAGNPPVIVDETADIALAAREIYKGASFDNNILCFAEKEAFVVDSVADPFIRNLVQEGAYLLDEAQTAQLLETVFVNKNGKYDINKSFVGRNANVLLEAIGIRDGQKSRLIAAVVPHDHPFVLVEQLMPVFPIVRCSDFEEAMEYALVAESGNRHTASIFSKNIDHMTQFGKLIETTIFVKNAATLSGVGIGGEGHVTMTIAGPTGEGLTCAKSFTRRRRCMLADGGLRIV